jgi:hypothetical protein
MTAMITRPVQKPRVGTPEHDQYARERGCTYKVPYSAEWVAKNAIIALGWVSGDFIGLETYHCRFCDHYHIGHP